MHQKISIAFPRARRAGVRELVDKATELRMSLAVADGKEPIPDGLEDLPEPGVDRVVSVPRPLLDVRDLVLAAAEDKHGILAALLANLDVGTIHGADE
eukprot:CAMPEP_0183459966 /NCGR_PEP_ID=MMETSP0370-20130417/136643_1 /TAXON_ID=268820 /ORGANISM="Peridinium aciculiferum, Strain PAER-2" /LENGTH=97 /DNA_ID=CAMNT_0025651833 /DNA_START=235 /DNA_END=528 /DNA_ORIENTATION=+